ncbi:glycoside hydrolase family 3 C-terminal domain-containing protein [Isoptericola sp. F-RaC21]|uniref:beta-glucosidase family protein n=1 Tax=Isoptericola sp. F-RaC21 TaxID=3141452 RepID=UPI00315BFB54
MTARSARRTILGGGTALAVLAAALAAGVTTTSAATTSSNECDDVAWTDTTRTPEERADALLAASSQHQKYRWLVEQPANNPQQTEFAPPYWAADAPTTTYPAQLPCTPTVAYTDGPEGVRSVHGVTAFPSAIALASTWDEQLAVDRFDAQADEAWAKGKNVVLAPGVAGGRTPLSGRTPEYLGEDPVLSGTMSAAGTRGLQQDGRVLANLKHFVGNEQELDRDTSSSDIDERTLRETYQLPFDIAVKRGDPASAMCSYNQVNGTHMCENPLLGRLADSGFDGYTVSDFGAVHSTADSLVNGLDQELNAPLWFTPAKLDGALEAGDITQQQIDDAARRVIVSYIRGGLFDNPIPATPAEDATTTEHTQVATRVAEQGSVLLKNDGALPLEPEPGQTIAVIGATASATPTDGVSAMQACGLALPEFTGSTRSMTCDNLVAIEDAVRERAAQDGADVVFDPGTDPAAAAKVAADADVAVVVGFQESGEFADRTDLHLDHGGDALIDSVSAANDNTVVVLQSGTAVEMPWLDDVRSVLEAWYGGDRQGPAVASLLFGDTNPSGKLPMTFPRSVDDTPTAGDPQRYPGTFADGSTTRPEGSHEIRQVDYSEGMQVGYRWYDAQGIEPLFPFGHGLSYTTFEYDDLQVTPDYTDGTEEVGIRFRLTNTGERTGTEVAQAYVELPPSAGEPSQRLAAWKRVTLEPGESTTVDLTLSPQDLRDLRLLQHWDTQAGAWATEPGNYRITVGSSSKTKLWDDLAVRSNGR